jgi:hypothetical protein
MKARKTAIEKTETTMWALLQWAYGPQKVRWCLPREPNLGYGRVSGTGLVCRDMSAGAVIRAHGARSSGDTHPDALTVHEYVARLEAAEYALVVGSAELGEPPRWDPSIAPCRVVPKRRGGVGAVEMLYAPRPMIFRTARGMERTSAIACLVECTGVHPDDAEVIRESARRIYLRWWSLTSILAGAISGNDELTRWTITGLGAERTPWSTGVRIAA